jgi:hypothetical protein
MPKEESAMAVVPERETNEQIEELNLQEGRTLFDRAARHYLKISGDEFLVRWECGEYDDDPDRPDVMRVAMLIPFGR